MLIAFSKLHINNTIKLFQLSYKDRKSRDVTIVQFSINMLTRYIQVCFLKIKSNK